MATATATEMAPLLVRAVGVAATMATTATTEETLIDGVMVVVFCRGVARSIFLWSQNFFLGSKKNKGKKLGETFRGTGTILMVLI